MAIRGWIDGRHHRLRERLTEEQREQRKAKAYQAEMNARVAILYKTSCFHTPKVNENG